MDRIQDFALLAVATAVLFITIGAGSHVAQLAHTASLPVVKLERVVVTAPAVPANVALADKQAR
ncbi:hypothetical protein BH09PSE6_BH09PSE6_31970 [soil metagenome]